MDPDEFVAQLAQFSQVEQLTNISSSMDNLTAAVDTTGLISVIGKKVGVESSTMSKGDELTIEPASDYDQVVLTITNLKDGTTSTVTFDEGDDLTYTSTSDDMVSISVKATLEGSTVGCSTMVFKEVTGVRIVDTGSVLTFANGETYDASKVTVIRN